MDAFGSLVFFFFFFGIVKVGKYALKRTLQVIKLRCQVVGGKKKNKRLAGTGIKFLLKFNLINKLCFKSQV